MTRRSPQWIDLTGGTPLETAVLDLFMLTSATEYVVSNEDFVQAGWKGEARKMPVGPGFVIVRADPLCPPGALWARPTTASSPPAKQLEDFKRALVAWIDAWIARSKP